MSKLIGKGGGITKDAASLANVVMFDWSESEGSIRGQKESVSKITLILDSDTVPLRVGGSATYVYTPGGNANWTITLTAAKITAASIPVVRDKSVTQDITLFCDTTATIA